MFIIDCGSSLVLNFDNWCKMLISASSQMFWLFTCTKQAIWNDQYGLCPNSVVFMAAANHDFLFSNHLRMIFLLNWFIIWTLQCQKMLKMSISVPHCPRWYRHIPNYIQPTDSYAKQKNFAHLRNLEPAMFYIFAFKIIQIIIQTNPNKVYYEKNKLIRTRIFSHAWWHSIHYNN